MESDKAKGEEGAVTTTRSCHHVLGVGPQQYQGSEEAEEGLGDSTNQCGGKFSRAVPTDARQCK